MAKKDPTSLTLNKLNFIFILLFCVSLLKVCAQDKPQSPSQAAQSRQKFIEEVKTHLGSPYKFGAYGPDSFDCSGLIFFCAREALEYQLPRTAKAIYNYVSIIPYENCEEGDLLFFKTTSSDTVSHVGIYIGNDQFISALSDGPNAGVSVSSLTQPYWQEKFVGTGQFIASAKDTKVAKKTEPKKEQPKKKKQSGKTDSLIGLGREEINFQYIDKNSKSESEPELEEKELTQVAWWFSNNIVAEESIFYDWSLLSPERFVFQYRGIDAFTHARYTGWDFEPGLGFGLCFNTGVHAFQLPLIASLSFNEYIRIYAGPVFTFGEAVLAGTEKTVKPTVFPGTFGVEFSTPELKIFGALVQAVQNISYTVFNNPYGEAPTTKEAFTSGLVLKTGIRVGLPLELFF